MTAISGAAYHLLFTFRYTTDPEPLKDPGCTGIEVSFGQEQHRFAVMEPLSSMKGFTQ